MSIRLLLAILLILPGTAYGGGIDLYIKYCSSCHHPDRYGLTGPPLIPETLKGKDDKAIKGIIKEGLPATNMPPFKGLIDDEGVEEIVAFIRSPLESPQWGREEILGTRKMAGLKGVERPLHTYDLSNLFMVVEGGTGRVAIMDGDSFKVLDMVKVGAVHGGPKFDHALRYAYMVSRDGWVVKYDLYQLKEVGRVKVGINTRNIAVSDDDRLLAVANTLPMDIVIIDTATLEPVRIIDVGMKVGAVYNLKGKGSFIANMRGENKLWLIRYREGISVEGLSLPEPFDDIFLEPKGRYVIGTSRRRGTMMVYDLERKKVVASVPMEGMPHLASAALWKDGDKTYATIPHINSPTLTVFRLYDWKVVKTVRTIGAGFFARTHRNIPQIWVDTGTDTVQVLSKEDLRVIKNLTPEPGKRAMHIEFTKDGRYALVSIWEKDGAVVVYDTRDLQEVMRIPFVKPVGKYNATNKRRIL